MKLVLVVSKIFSWFIARWWKWPIFLAHSWHAVCMSQSKTLEQYTGYIFSVNPVTCFDRLWCWKGRAPLPCAERLSSLNVPIIGQPTGKLRFRELVSAINDFDYWTPSDLWRLNIQGSGRSRLGRHNQIRRRLSVLTIAIKAMCVVITKTDRSKWRVLFPGRGTDVPNGALSLSHPVPVRNATEKVLTEIIHSALTGPPSWAKRSLDYILPPIKLFYRSANFARSRKPYIQTQLAGNLRA